jgi:hypothetical protein
MLCKKNGIKTINLGLEPRASALQHRRAARYHCASHFAMLVGIQYDSNGNHLHQSVLATASPKFLGSEYILQTFDINPMAFASNRLCSGLGMIPYLQLSRTQRMT